MTYLTKLSAALLLLISLPFLFLLAGATVNAVTLYLEQAHEERGICTRGERIDSSREAIDYAKKLIVREQRNFKEAGFQKPGEYLATIEARSDCCSASYGLRSFENAPSGWSVSIEAKHLKNEFSHIVEFSRCGHVSYLGGLSHK